MRWARKKLLILFCIVSEILFGLIHTGKSLAGVLGLVRRFGIDGYHGEFGNSPCGNRSIGVVPISEGIMKRFIKARTIARHIVC